MEPCMEIEKKALLWRLAEAGLSDAANFNAEDAALVGEAQQIFRSKPLANEHPTGNLENVFNCFGAGEGEPSFFPFALGTEAALYPEQRSHDAPADYSAAKTFLRSEMEKNPAENRSVNDILRLAEIAASTIPSSSDTPDISLYMEAKLTAALSVCLWQYAKEHGNASAETADDAPAFLLASGDLSGIQAFIYTIPSAGALKSLRGRSFYLDVLLENMADEILAACGLGRSCLLYTGGGHFYLLLPNTEAVQGVLTRFVEEANGWFLRHFGNRLYVAMAWEPGTKTELRGGIGELYRRVSRQLSQKKFRRYNADQLRAMFSPTSAVNATRGGSRECGVCHTSTSDLEPYAPENDKGTLAYPVCRNPLPWEKPCCKATAFLSEQNRKPTPCLSRA